MKHNTHKSTDKGRALTMQRKQQRALKLKGMH